MLSAVGPETPKTIITSDKLVSSSKTEVKTIHSKESQLRWTQFQKLQQVSAEDGNEKTQNWQEGKHSDDIFNEDGEKFLEMMV